MTPKWLPKWNPKWNPKFKFFFINFKMHPKMVPKMMPIPELLENDHQMVSNWYQNDPKRSPKSNPQ